MALLVIAFRSFRFDRERGGFTPDYHGFTAGLFFGAGLVLSFAVGALFFSVTTMTELRRSLDALPAAPRRLFSRLTGSRLKPPEAGWSRLGLGISLMLGFLPRFFEIWEEARAAYQARGGGKAGHFRLIPLVTVRMVELAAETALALESRSLFSAASGGFKQRPAKRL
jgi:biotin transport system permease protein